MPRIQLPHSYEDIISLENILHAWREFVKGKRQKPDVQQFGRHLMRHVLALRQDLEGGSYEHGEYHYFRIRDPKPRDIHKASVRDRLLHHALYRVLYPFFEKTFIADSYSCRIRKGTHRAISRFRTFTRRLQEHSPKTIWVLKCDIQKFFASIDHEVLLRILESRITDTRILLLLRKILASFNGKSGRGLPLGNLTSQLLVNIYMNEFDQFVKHKLRIKYYVRYADDFVFLSQDKDELLTLLPYISYFLYGNLRLTLHPQKIQLRTLGSGVDFLGWVHFSDHCVLRTSTRKRALNKVKASVENAQVLNSYLGLLSHGNTYKIQEELRSLLRKE